MRYYNKTNQPGHELFLSSARPDLVYTPANPEHIELAEANVYWDTLAQNTALTYDGNGVPNGTQAIAISVEDQTSADLHTAGITNSTLALAYYKNHRGDPTLLATVDGVIDAVVISSGLSLAQVSELV
jgi:hypothetical protein